MITSKSFIHIALFTMTAFSAVSVLLCQTENITRLKAQFIQNPRSYSVNYNLGVEYFRSGQYESAEKLFELAMLFAPSKEEKARAAYNAACAEYKQGKGDEAKSSLKTSLTLNPSDNDAKYNYSLLSIKYKGASAKESQSGEEKNKSNNDKTKNEPQTTKSGSTDAKQGIKDSESILNAVKNREMQIIKEMKDKKVKKTPNLRYKTW